jgi:putative nucleotidyltransferase with HDIG domain
MSKTLANAPSIWSHATIILKRTTPRSIIICLAFADVIDAKSPFTYRHSTGVAGAAVSIARTLSMRESDVTLIRRAALLHDIGKLGVSNAILDKPGKLTDEEWEVVLAPLPYGGIRFRIS